jgi:hypothetical protein
VFDWAAKKANLAHEAPSITAAKTRQQAAF